MKSDGSIIIDTKIIDGGMEKGFEIIKDEMASVGITAKQIGDQIEVSFSKIDVSKPIANAAASVQQLERQLETVTADFKNAIAEDDDKSAERLAEKRIRVYEQLEAAREKLTIEIAHAAQKEAEAQEKASNRAIKAAEKEAEAKKKAQEKQYREATKGARNFNSRLRGIISGALVFNLISAGLRSMTKYFGNALKSNKEFTASVSQLKGALLTAFQPIYEYIAPAIIYLIQLLTRAAQVIGQFVAAISGQSYSQAQKNAEDLYKEADAIGAVGGAAKEAKKQLMGFDAINKLESPTTGGGGAGGGSILPNFSAQIDPKIKGNLDDILRVVGAIGAAIAAWKIAKIFTTNLSKLFGIAFLVGGAFLYATSWIDAFANGIDWSNLSGTLYGIAGIAAGLLILFGSTAGAVGLLAGGIGLVVVALKEWIETGELSDEAFAALEAGILIVGAALSILTGSWIPLAVAAAVGLVTAIATRGEEIKEILGDAIEWIKNIFVRDWTEIFGDGLGKPLNNLTKRFGDTWDSIKKIAGGIIDFIQNIFAGNWSKALGGLVDIARGIANGIISIINSVIRAVVDGINTVLLVVTSLPLPGGKTLGTYSPIEAPQIPYLAKGAVIPANNEFLAVLGDQKSGRNLEAPESLIRQIVREESGTGNSDRVEQLLETLIAVVEGIEVGDEVIGRAAARYNRSTARARGY